jgi:hypothetical protein
MDAFPVAPELMQAFPLGALSLLVTVASTVAAQHGVEAARRICHQLAGNDELWGFIARRVDRLPAIVDNVEQDTRDDVTSALRETAGAKEAATSENGLTDPLHHESDGSGTTVALPAESLPANPTEVLHDGAAAARPSKAKRRRRQKANGVRR